MRGGNKGIDIQLHCSRWREEVTDVLEIVNDRYDTFRRKPLGGLWTSTWLGEERGSAWVQWCRANEYGSPDTENWFLLRPKKNARLYVLDNYNDLLTLIDKFPYETDMYRSYARTEGRKEAMRYLTIDFEKLAGYYDGLHLTERGNNQLHYCDPPHLNAWDVESTVWFRWCFTSVERIKQGITEEVL